MGLEVRKQNLLADLHQVQGRIKAGELPERALTEHLGGLSVMDCKLLLVAVEEDQITLRAGRCPAWPHKPGLRDSTSRPATNPSAMSAAAI